MKKKEIRFQEEKDDYYEYYDSDYEYVDTNKQTFREVKSIKKPRPKIVPKQRIVPKLSKPMKKQNLHKIKSKFSSFVTPAPRTIGEILGTVKEPPTSR